MIDLHLHTTASDGCLAPPDLVRRAVAAGVRVLSVTDHDTMAGVPGAAAEAARLGVELVPGIEITAVHESQDVHVLGYFLKQDDPRLSEFLDRQREDRVRRVGAMADRLAALGMPVEYEPALAAARAQPGRAVGRPLLAQAMVERGYVADTRQAFDAWLGQGRPAFLPRIGASPAAVVRLIREAGGVSSIAHPGLTSCDALVPALAADGLDAIEVYHADHTPEMTARYRAMADSLGLLVSGGSDYHAEVSHRAPMLGFISLPRDAYDALSRRAASRATASGASTSS